MKRCRIITTTLGGGKSTYIKSLIDNDKDSVGFFSIKREGAYVLMNISTKEERLLMSTLKISNQRFGRFYVDESVFGWANDILLGYKDENVYIDEVGRMELLGMGFDRALREIAKRDITLTIAVRDEFVDAIISKYGLLNAMIAKVPYIENYSH